MVITLENGQKYLLLLENAFTEGKYFLSVTPTSSAIVNLKNRNITSSNRSKTVNRINQLREDIQAGRVVKVPTINGFIWKRVK